MTERATGQGSVPVDAPFERGELAVNAHTVLPNPLRRLTKPAGTKPCACVTVHPLERPSDVLRARQLERLRALTRCVK